MQYTDDWDWQAVLSALRELHAILDQHQQPVAVLIDLYHNTYMPPEHIASQLQRVIPLHHHPYIQLFVVLLAPSPMTAFVDVALHQYTSPDCQFVWVTSPADVQRHIQARFPQVKQTTNQLYPDAKSRDTQRKVCK